jgi:hypothetical protein
MWRRSLWILCAAVPALLPQVMVVWVCCQRSSLIALQSEFMARVLLLLLFISAFL